MLEVNTLPEAANLRQIKIQAKELVRNFESNQASARELFTALHPKTLASSKAKLSDAQLVIARSYGYESWPKLVADLESRQEISELQNAINQGNVEKVEAIIRKTPPIIKTKLNRNWGPPMSFAANLGQLEIAKLLDNHGAKDHQYAFERACLQGQLETAEWLLSRGAILEKGAIMGSCETLNADGFEFLIQLGAGIMDKHGDPLAPIALILETYSRDPNSKHRCLAICEKHGIEFPNTPAMAFHRGRIDLLESFYKSDSGLVNRRFSLEEIYPTELGCASPDKGHGLHGTPLDGTTLLHMAIDFDEQEIFDWLIEQGADVNAVAEIDSGGFGGHTPLFNTVVSQPVRFSRQKDGAMAHQLLRKGAKPNAIANIRKRMPFTNDEPLHEYRNVTPLAYGNAFSHQEWVNETVVGILTG